MDRMPLARIASTRLPSSQNMSNHAPPVLDKTISHISVEQDGATRLREMDDEGLESFIIRYFFSSRTA